MGPNQHAKPIRPYRNAATFPPNRTTPAGPLTSRAMTGIETRMRVNLFIANHLILLGNFARIA
jgi:hypothetical protein